MSILVLLVSLLPVFSQEFLALINCLLAVRLLGGMTRGNISKLDGPNIFVLESGVV